MDRKIKVITTTSDLSKCYQLRRSLIHHGYDFHFIKHDWEPVGFLGKIHETYKYLKGLEGYTHFLYTDAWDTFAVRDPEELEAKIPDGLVISAERACYPYPELAVQYPEVASPWKYVNGGGWCGEITAFLDLYERYTPTTEINDQVWLTLAFLNHNKDGGIQLDNNCRIFQTIGFCPESDFEVGYYFSQYDWYPFMNNITKSRPLFIHGNGHTPMSHIYASLPVAYDTLISVRSIWEDRLETHREIAQAFTDRVNATPELSEYRDWIEANSFGFGERCFLWMWKLILDEYPSPDFLEMGVYKGQILGLVRMLSPSARVTGITPLDGTDGHKDSNYEADIKTLHDTFGLEQPVIIKGLSTDDAVMEQVGEYDIIYIDGGHSYEVAKHDVFKYSSHVRVGGLLVIDDCAHKYDLPAGYFKGIESVSRAVDELLPNDYYEELFNVGHNRIFKRVK